MKVVVTGSTGQLGSELCRQLGDRATGLSRNDLDITHRMNVQHFLRTTSPDVVINTAAYTNVDKAEEDVEVCRTVNVAGVENLSEACRNTGATLVQISTDYVFGSDLSRETPYTESDRPGPLGVYGQSKLDGERVAAQYERHLIVRTCGLYGLATGDRPAHNFVETMLHLARSRTTLQVVDDQRCCPSYVPDVARAIVHLIETKARGTFHVVNRGETTWFEFAKEIFRQSRIDIDLRATTTKQYALPARRPAYSVLDTTKYQALAGPIMPQSKASLATYLTERSVQHPDS